MAITPQNNPSFRGQIPFFLDSFLGKPASALPKGAQWVLRFEGPYNETGDQDFTDILPVPAIKKGIAYEPTVWDIEKAIEVNLLDDYQKVKGCLFAQAVQIPGESNQVNPEGLQQSGYIRSVTGGGRDAFQNLQITFLETNISFVDNVIRPWVIATAHLGMIARSGDSNYRCNLSVYKLGSINASIDDNTSTPYLAQKYTFFGVCPISVESEEYNYTQTTSPVNRNATFIYHYYTLETPFATYNDVTKNISLPLPKSTSQRYTNVNNI